MQPRRVPKAMEPSTLVSPDRPPDGARYTAAVSSVLADVFRQNVRNPHVQDCASPDLERRLHEILDISRATWPGLDVPEDAFVRHLAENLPDEGDLDGSLARMHCADLYLAYGCVVSDPAALAAFDRSVWGQVAPVLHRMGLSASQVDEVVQVMRAKLLVSDEGGHRPLMTSYAGRGALVGWVRTATRRTALSMGRNMDEQLCGAEEDRDLERIPLPADMELDYIKGRYQAEFKQAVEDAIATLDAEHMRVLRLYYTDELSVDRIGALLGVHRATAARRVRAASEAVRAETRRLLRARLALSANEIDSLAGLVQSQLHLSLGRLLKTR